MCAGSKGGAEMDRGQTINISLNIMDLLIIRFKEITVLDLLLRMRIGKL